VDKLGEELWQLGQLVTKYSEITSKYRSYNARVDTNDGRSLQGQIVDNVGRLLKKRLDAVKVRFMGGSRVDDLNTLSRNEANL